jgi:hypothetical protein
MDKILNVTIDKNRQGALESLKCAREAMANIHQKTLTEDDFEKAFDFMGLDNSNHIEFIGQKIEKNLLCEFTFIAEKIAKQGLPLDEVPDGFERKILSEHLSGKDNKDKILPNIIAAERILENCEVKNYHNLKLHHSSEKLSDIFEGYSNQLLYSECSDQSAVEALRSMPRTNFPIFTYEEAVEEIGKIMDADDSIYEIMDA